MTLTIPHHTSVQLRHAAATNGSSHGSDTSESTNLNTKRYPVNSRASTIRLVDAFQAWALRQVQVF